KAPTGLKELDKGNSVSKDLQGKLGASSLPAALTVISKEAPLYARHDEFANKIAQLSQGERLVPVLQTDSGKTLWYMVKTETGTTGWVKASDVGQETVQKK
ncbi:MAG TPA: SH3 domain-containing protein, partial [Candidatus Binatia bacterium]|nr:SH3 domain-containing protein [Candidatus Binatia bacterium]